MSQCIDCANRPSENDNLGQASHEGAMTPTVIGVILGTVVVFVLVLCALFYCVKMETHRRRRKMTAAESSLEATTGSSLDEEEAPPGAAALGAVGAVEQHLHAHGREGGTFQPKTKGVSAGDGGYGKKRVF